MIIEKILDVNITRCYGNSNENNTRGKLNIPKKILKAMELTEDSKTVKLLYDEKKNELIIRKI